MSRAEILISKAQVVINEFVNDKDNNASDGLYLAIANMELELIKIQNESKFNGVQS